MRDENQLESEIAVLLADPEYQGHPLREALGALFERQREQIANLERLTSISDGYQQVLHQKNRSLADRYKRQVRQLEKIVRISDHYQEMMRDLNEKLKVVATQDPLTGLANRRLITERLEAEAALSRRQNVPFSIILADVDHFKEINDGFGHAIGDQVLVALSHALCESLRGYDICSRWGGEEFLFLLPRTTGDEAHQIGDRMRSIIQNLRHPDLPDDLQVTVSLGIAQFAPESDLDNTIKRADDALYGAKNAGRNRSVLAP